MKKHILIGAGVLVALAALFGYGLATRGQPSSQGQAKVIIRDKIDDSGLETATFAGGCFWCTEAVLQETDGVRYAISGYAGGTEYDPTYEQVYTESTGHREAVRVYYDPKVTTYDKLLDVYWRSTDPTDGGGQFIDRGFSYTPAVFYETKAQKTAAEKYKAALERSGKFDKPIATKILPFTTFYEAEDYHQDFYIKSTERYESYKYGSGREEFKKNVWKQIQLEQSE